MTADELVAAKMRPLLGFARGLGLGGAIVREIHEAVS